LLSVLRASDPEVAAEAALALGKLKDTRAIDPLFQVLNGRFSREYIPAQINAAWALGEIGDPRAVDALIQTLNDLGSHDSKTDIRAEVVLALGKLHDNRAFDPLLKAVGGYDSCGGIEGAFPKVRMNASLSLGKLGTIDQLILALNPTNREVRSNAAIALGYIKDPQSVDPLILALEDDYIDMRITAAWALGEIGDRRAVRPLIKILQDPDSNARSYAARALGKIGDNRAIDPLIQALSNDQAVSVRVNSIEALAKFEDDRIIDPLIKALEDDSSNVRLAAISSLEKIGNSIAIEPLNRIAHDDDNQDVRDAAKIAIDKIINNPSASFEPIQVEVKSSQETSDSDLHDIEYTNEVNPMYLSDIGAYHIQGEAKNHFGSPCNLCIEFEGLCEPCIKYNMMASLEVGKTKYDKGIKIKCKSGDDFLADFHLSKKYSRLIGLVGLDDETSDKIDKEIKIIFEGDGKELHTIDVGDGNPLDVDIDVKDIYRLRVRVINDNNSDIKVDLLNMLLSN